MLKKVLSLILALNCLSSLSHGAEDFVLEEYMLTGVEKFFGILYEGTSLDESSIGITEEEYSEGVLKKLRGRNLYSENIEKRIRANQPIRKQQFYIDRVNKMLKGAASEKFGKQYISYFADKGVSVGEKEVVSFLLSTVTLTKIHKIEYPEFNGASHEELAAHYLEMLAQYFQVSFSVTDVKSAELAAEELATLAEKFVCIGKVLSEMQTPSDELRVKVQGEMDVLSEAFQKSLAELRSNNTMEPAAGVIFTAAIKDFIKKSVPGMNECGRHFLLQDKDK
ncbi:hypothetical protein [Rubritalea profundi]|uniref:Uncharacterized protein n=1 Tax=Rubritalea profundi TaxID=1658618 RepID=A0A2S7TZ99_9BACT|nr:hypothetical protein [Rubritalea profundi]PQJ27454.1 hypothetical protein BSZ32_02375 [Rubritalea profundi]